MLDCNRIRTRSVCLMARLRGYGLVAPAAVLLALASCTPAGPRAARPEAPAPATGFIEEGIASWYGPGFHGRQTASGEIFDQDALTAAHPSLPFGTRLRVVNLANGREVLVRINDRGPFAGGRIIDLSRAAARRLDMLQAGIVPVRIFAADDRRAGT